MMPSFWMPSFSSKNSFLELGRGYSPRPNIMHGTIQYPVLGRGVGLPYTVLTQRLMAWTH